MIPIIIAGGNYLKNIICCFFQKFSLHRIHHGSDFLSPNSAPWGTIRKKKTTE